MINVKFRRKGDLKKIEELMESGGVYRGLCIWNALFFQLGWVVSM